MKLDISNYYVMKKHIVFLTIFVFCNLVANAQDSILLKQAQRIAALEKQCRDLQQRNDALQREVVRMDQRGLVLSAKTDSNSRAIKQLADNMNVRLTETNASIDENVAEVNKGVQSRTVWGIVVAGVLVLLTAGVFLLLRERIAKKGDDIELLRARADALNHQMVERMDKELTELQKIAEGIAAMPPAKPSAPSETKTSPVSVEPDHSLVKALADRITFMEMTLYRMDSSVKGHKHLTKTIRQMKDNLLANGYELVDMLGKEYVEGMKVVASFITDDSLEEGKQIITGIQKPQINFKGKMIQAAQIIVSQNI